MDGNLKLNITTADNESDCNLDAKPKTTRACNTGPCFYQWRAQEFGDVSESLRVESMN